MKKSVCTTFFALLGGAYLCFVISACKNFLNAANVKEDIEKHIYIANHECPVAKVEEPAFSDEGVAKNKSIIISFSKSMKTDNFIEKLSITDSSGKDLKEHFLAPQWSNDNKLVTIPANERNLIDLGGKSTFDIYIKLSKSFSTPDELPLTAAIDQKYRIKNTIDNIAPTLNTARAELPGEYIGRQTGSTTILVEGPLTAQTEDAICNTNHINSMLDIYVEGSDYGGGYVFGYVQYKRVFDSVGKAVNEEYSYCKEALSTENDAGQNYGKFRLDLSSPSLKDGMYEITVRTIDTCEAVSQEYKTFYVIRDTTLLHNINGAIFFYKYPKYNMSNLINMKKDCYCFNLCNILDDVYYVSNINKNNESNNSYKTIQQNYTYYYSWGLSLDELKNCTPSIIQGEYYIEAPENGAPEYSMFFQIPNEFINIRESKEYIDKEIFLQLIIEDAVGNKDYITTLLPKKPEIYGYNVENNRISIKFSDVSKNKSQFSSIPDKYNNTVYRFFCGKWESGRNKSDVEFYSDYIDYISNVVLESNSRYIFYIQKAYSFNSNYNSSWLGWGLGPFSEEIIVDTSENPSATIKTPTFEVVKKESAGVNTRTFNVFVKIKNYEANVSNNVKYVPLYSLDNGQTWIYGDAQTDQEFSFPMQNPLHAPLRQGEAWVVESSWHPQGGIYWQAVENCQTSYGYPEVTAQVKILACTDYKSVESESSASIVFEEDDDNIPPFVSHDVITHDSKLSYDGHSFSFPKIFYEDECHISKYLNYYYMPYNNAWGNNLSVVSDEEIENLPGGMTTFDAGTWMSTDAAYYSFTLKIPLSGLEDGDYMFFAKPKDDYGNYAYITLGKAHVGTFKNKLKVEYNPSKNPNHFICTLPIESDEHFDRNMINVRVFETEPDGQGNERNIWIEHYGHLDGCEWLNQLQNCETIIIDGKIVLYNENKDEADGEFVGADWLNGADPYYVRIPNPLRKGFFYQITMQGFNVNSYDSNTKTGVNWFYQRPYRNYNDCVDSPDCSYQIIPNLENQTEYDLCTEETVSNTVYYYLPKENEDLSDCRASFEKANASPRSNHPFIVNVLTSLRDLGENVDEWERRGKLIKTHYYENSNNEKFDYNTAMDDLFESQEKGSLYYAIVVHYADNTSDMSEVRTISLH